MPLLDTLLASPNYKREGASVVTCSSKLFKQVFADWDLDGVCSHVRQSYLFYHNLF